MSGDPETYAISQLLSRVRAGEPDAFAQLSARYLWLVRGKAQHFTGAGVPEQEDLFQEGLLGLYVAARTYDEGGGASFATYAGICIYNRMASAVRRHMNSGNRTLNESLSLSSDDACALSTGEEPGMVVELQEQLAQLHRQMEAALSPLEHRVVTLYLGGCRRRELPQRLGISQKACDNALHRVRAKLRGLRR